MEDDPYRRPSLKSLGKNSREMVQTLYGILDHCEDHTDFHAYLKEKHNEELIDFYREFRSFAFRHRKITEEEQRVWAFRLYDTRAAASRGGRRLFQSETRRRYLVDGAKHSVNLGENAANIRFHIHKQFAAGNFAPNVLEPAVDSCLLLVAMGDLHKFAKHQRTRFIDDDAALGDSEVPDGQADTNLTMRNVTRSNFLQALESYGCPPGCQPG